MTLRASLVVVSGPSGVGKSTVCQRLLATGRFVRSVSATTRRPRGAERDGVDYFFLDRAELLRRVDRGELLEWAQVHGELYGTPARPVLENLEAGLHVLLNIDVQGAAQLRQRGLPIATVFLLPPSLEALRARLEGRRDTPPGEVEKRLLRAAEEMAQADRYDLRVVNDDLDRAVGEILRLLGEPGPSGG